MEEIHRKILRQNRSFLVKEIEDVHGITDHLHEKDILTTNMVQDILAEKTPIAQARKLLDILPKRGRTAFDTFCNVLIRTGQRDTAVKLNPQLAHSGVTPLEPSNRTVPSSGSHHAGGKISDSGYPVPVQKLFEHNETKTTTPTSNSEFNLPQPTAFGASGGKSGSQPSTPNDVQNQQPKFGTQESREETPYDPEEEEILENFPKPKPDWPKLNLTLASADFKVRFCTGEEVKKQLNDPNIYPMSEDKERRALIISNRTFDGDIYEERKLTDYDSIRIHQVLKKMGFKIQSSSNVKKEELENILAVEQGENSSKLCMFVVVILSYGGTGTIMCADGKMLPVQDIVNMFSAKQCPSMIGIPKVFLIQACGAILKNVDDNLKDTTSKVDSASQGIIEGMESLTLGTAAVTGKTVTDTRGSLHSSSSESSLSDPVALENTGDILVAMATTADTSHTQYTSEFMLALSFVISNFSKSYHFISLLKGVNKLKCEQTGNVVKLCEFKHSFTRKLYLLPGYPHDTPGGATGNFYSGPFGSTKPS